MLVEEFELGILWDEYGLVGDIIVCILLFFFVVIFAHIGPTALH
jgi:hypothetical protein